MTTKLRSHVGADGMLTLQLPAGVTETDVDVEITVRPISEAAGFAAEAERREWQAFVERTAGSIDDPSFYRHDQGVYEEREELT